MKVTFVFGAWLSFFSSLIIAALISKYGFVDSAGDATITSAARMILQISSLCNGLGLGFMLGTAYQGALNG